MELNIMFIKTNHQLAYLSKIMNYYKITKPIYSTLLLCALSTHLSFSQNKTQSLKSAYQEDFLIGTALGTEHILERNEKANVLIKREFNAITPENIMKSQLIHPAPNRYNFDLADKYVEYGLKTICMWWVILWFGIHNYQRLLVKLKVLTLYVYL